MIMTNEKGTDGLLFKDAAGTLLNVSAWPYSMEDLFRAQHIHELPRRENIILNIDYRQKGVGGDKPGLLMLHDEYKLKRGLIYRYSFTVKCGVSLDEMIKNKRLNFDEEIRPSITSLIAGEIIEGFFL